MLDIVNDSRNRMGMLKPTKGTECPSGADSMALSQTVLPWVALFFEISDCLPSCPFIAVLGCLLFSEISPSNVGCCIDDRDRMPSMPSWFSVCGANNGVRLRSSTQTGKDVETDDICPICFSAEVPMMRDSMFWSAVSISIHPIQETVFLEPAFLGLWLKDSHISDLPIFH